VRKFPDSQIFHQLFLLAPNGNYNVLNSTINKPTQLQTRKLNYKTQEKPSENLLLNHNFLLLLLDEEIFFFFALFLNAQRFSSDPTPS